MTGSTKIFLSGAALAALVVLAGIANTRRLETRFHDLEVNCARDPKMVCELDTLIFGQGAPPRGYSGRAGG